MKEKNKIFKILIYIIIVVSIFIRIIFVNKSDIGLFQYDMGLYNFLNSETDYDKVYTDFDKDPIKSTHMNYIMHLYEYGKLPSENEIIGQFYHPPLHHFIMSIVLKGMDVFSDISSLKLEGLQYIIIIYSIIILIGLYKILEELDIEEKYKIIPMILFSFYPLYIYLSGSINNDELVSMFCILSFLYLLKWEKNQSYKNTILVACFIGLGLMTKTSAIIMIIPSIYIYFKTLKKLAENDKNIKKLIFELIIFNLIIIILGGWFHIYNNFTTITIYPPKEEMRVSTDNIGDRFGFSNLLKANKYNVWNYLLYSSISFEKFSSENLIIKEMVILAFILLIDILYYSIKYFKENLLINITNIVWLIFYIYLQTSLPYECSMHARYMSVPFALGIVAISVGMQKDKNLFLKYQTAITSITLSILSIKLILGTWGP